MMVLSPDLDIVLVVETIQAPEVRSIVSTGQLFDERAQESAADTVCPVRPEQPRQDVAVAYFQVRDLQDVERIEPTLPLVLRDAMDAPSVAFALPMVEPEADEADERRRSRRATAVAVLVGRGLKVEQATALARR